MRVPLHFAVRDLLTPIEQHVQRTAFFVKEQRWPAVFQYLAVVELEARDTHILPGGSLTLPAGAHLNVVRLDNRDIALETRVGCQHGGRHGKQRVEA